jgi:magnesium-transporting ATPase (P-type)
LDRKEDLKKTVINRFADKSLRTLAIAYKDLEYNPAMLSSDAFLESDLNLIAIVGIKDPLRNEIPEAVKTCKKAGIQVKMVTGDNLNTAVAIAKECGILGNREIEPEEYEIMEGKRFRELVGGLTYENPNMKNPLERGEAKVTNFAVFKQIAT